MDATERRVLVLQGGGALGAYQAGAFAELERQGHMPSWIAGISIGAINAAIIAGNPPELREERLRAFWDIVSADLRGFPFVEGSQVRSFFNEASASMAVARGIPGFFSPRFPPAALQPPGTPAAISHYDTRPMRETLENLVDFDRISSGKVRLSVGAVNVETGNFSYFDSEKMTLGPEHVMASGALPPGFPPIEVDGQLYWDGGLVSNTPLQFVLDESGLCEDMCIFQIDLFSARGAVPETIWQVEQREKDIRFSSRTRLNTDVFKNIQRLRSAAGRLCAKLPDALADDPDARFLREFGRDSAITIVHLIHRRAAYESGSKDYEFSRLSVNEHWDAGQDDVRRTLRRKAWRTRQRPENGIAVFDLTHNDGE